MRSRLILLASFVMFVLVPAQAWPIVIETGPKQRVGGFLVEEDAKQVTVKIVAADGTSKNEKFERAKIKIIHKVDVERLQKLSKDRPKLYRDYAEELAEVKDDPEARELALRLFLIAAHLDSAKLGRSCLVSMSNIATRSADARKFRAMAYLLDPKADVDLLKIEPPKTAPVATPAAKAATKALIDFEKALKYYRNGQVKQAKDYANEKGVADYFTKSGLGDHRSFLQACSDVNCTKCKAGSMTCASCMGKGMITDKFGFGMQPCTTCSGKGKQKCTSCGGSGMNEVSEDYLKAILRAEVWALEQILNTDTGVKKGGWDVPRQSDQAAVSMLTLETITSFDPRKCVYRNKEWVLP
jgi:hypothetical protein